MRYDAAATTVDTPFSPPVVLTERADFGVANNDGSQPDGTNARRFQVAIFIRVVVPRHLSTANSDG